LIPLLIKSAAQKVEKAAPNDCPVKIISALGYLFCNSLKAAQNLSYI